MEQTKLWRVTWIYTTLQDHNHNHSHNKCVWESQLSKTTKSLLKSIPLAMKSSCRECCLGQHHLKIHLMKAMNQKKRNITIHHHALIMDLPSCYHLGLSTKSQNHSSRTFVKKVNKVSPSFCWTWFSLSRTKCSSLWWNQVWKTNFCFWKELSKEGIIPGDATLP